MKRNGFSKGENTVLLLKIKLLGCRSPLKSYCLSFNFALVMTKREILHGGRISWYLYLWLSVAKVMDVAEEKNTVASLTLLAFARQQITVSS